MNEKKTGRYADIIGLSRPTSARPRMSMAERAAQFSPFDALTGFEDVIGETARYTESKPELEEEERDALDRKLAEIAGSVALFPKVRFTVFLPDEKKAGGRLCRVTGSVKRVDTVKRTVVFTDGSDLNLDAVTEIELLSDFLSKKSDGE